MPTLQPAGFEFRDAGLELQHAQVGDDDDRLVAGHGARVVVALDDVAGHRRARGSCRAALRGPGAARRRPAPGWPGPARAGRRPPCWRSRRRRGAGGAARPSRTGCGRGRVRSRRSTGRPRRRPTPALATLTVAVGGIGLRVDLAAVDGGHGLALAHRRADVDEHPFEGAGHARLEADARAGRQVAREFERGFDGAGLHLDGRDVHRPARRPAWRPRGAAALPPQADDDDEREAGGDARRTRRLAFMRRDSVGDGHGARGAPADGRARS